MCPDHSKKAKKKPLLCGRRHVIEPQMPVPSLVARCAFRTANYIPAILEISTHVSRAGTLQVCSQQHLHDLVAMPSQGSGFSFVSQPLWSPMVALHNVMFLQSRSRVFVCRKGPPTRSMLAERRLQRTRDLAAPQTSFPIPREPLKSPLLRRRSQSSEFTRFGCASFGLHRRSS